MIGYLKGKVALRKAEIVILDVNGVGYELSCPLTTVEKLPNRAKTQRCSLRLMCVKIKLPYSALRVLISVSSLNT